MDEPSAVSRHAALAVSSRRRLLEALRSSDEPVEVVRLAAAAGLHVTTARFHLDVLERAGLVHRSTERAGRPGRPRQLYSAASPGEVTEGHRQLAEVLASALASDPASGPSQAEAAGWRWADSQVAVEEALPPEQATERVGELFDRLGFAPRPVRTGGHVSLRLEECPFRDVARAHPQVVCTIHLGLLRGALHRSGLPVEQAVQAGLRPFVEPELCMADLPFPDQGPTA